MLEKYHFPLTLKKKTSHQESWGSSNSAFITALKSPCIDRVSFPFRHEVFHSIVPSPNIVTCLNICTVEISICWRNRFDLGCAVLPLHQKYDGWKIKSMLSGQLSFKLCHFLQHTSWISVGSLYTLGSLLGLLCDIYLLQVSSAASHALLEALWWDYYLPNILWISVEMKINLLLCMWLKSQEFLHNVYFRCLICYHMNEEATNIPWNRIARFPAG